MCVGVAAARRIGSSPVGLGTPLPCIRAPHLARPRTAGRQAGEDLRSESPTLLNYCGRPATEDLGGIGDGGGRGFKLHSALAVRGEAWTLAQRPAGTVTGLFGQECRTPRPAPKGQTRRERWRRPRTSPDRGRRLQIGRPAPPQAASGFTWRIGPQYGVAFIIRAYHGRRLADTAVSLQPALDQAPGLGQRPGEVREVSGPQAWKPRCIGNGSPRCRARHGHKGFVWGAAIPHGGGSQNITKPSSAARAWKSARGHAPTGWSP